MLLLELVVRFWVTRIHDQHLHIYQCLCVSFPICIFMCFIFIIKPIDSDRPVLGWKRSCFPARFPQDFSMAKRGVKMREFQAKMSQDGIVQPVAPNALGRSARRHRGLWLLGQRRENPNFLDFFRTSFERISGVISTVTLVHTKISGFNLILALFLRSWLHLATGKQISQGC